MGIGALMQKLESKKKFSWSKGDSDYVIREMEKEKLRIYAKEETDKKKGEVK